MESTQSARPAAPEQTAAGKDGGSVARGLRRMAAEMVGHRAELTRLDQEIGDGDHGENLARGFSAVLAKLPADFADTPAEALKLVATTLISTVGGASGPLLGSAFLRASTAVGPGVELTPAAAAAALVAARDAVVARGKADPGDKTMVDAWSPAAAAGTAAARDGADVAGVLAAAADAAETGAESTVGLRAKKGRAAYLGDRSVGHVDPGARSTALLLRSLARSAAGTVTP